MRVVLAVLAAALGALALPPEAPLPPWSPLAALDVDPDHPDFRVYSRADIAAALPRVFEELPSAPYETDQVNACWDAERRRVCLPRLYLLGQPKCGTSDLWDRFHFHELAGPRARRKETRFLTPGEFSSERPAESRIHRETLGAHSSILTGFVEMFPALDADENDRVLFDGGPHYLWWSTTPMWGPDPEYKPPSVPMILRAIQPTALLVVTLREPGDRSYSDYWFLAPSGRPARVEADIATRSPEDYHTMVVAMMNEFDTCARDHGKANCAHRLDLFGRPGSPRIAAGMYAVFLHKWLRAFPREQMLVLRMEDMASHRQSEMRRVFQFAGMPEPSPETWESILFDGVANARRFDRPAMLPETRQALHDFFRPFNELIGPILGEPESERKWLWEDYSSHGVGDSGVPSPDRRLLRERRDMKRNGSRADRVIEEELNNPHNRPNPAGNAPKELVEPLSGDLDAKGKGDVEDTTRLCRLVDICALAFELDVEDFEKRVRACGDVAELSTERETVLHCLASGSLFSDQSPISFLMDMVNGKMPPYVEHHFSEIPDLSRGTVSHHAIMSGVEKPLVSMLKIVLTLGIDIDVNKPNSQGMTALYAATFSGMTDMMRILLEVGADPFIPNEVGRTPAHVAVISGCAQCVTVLHAHDATVLEKTDHRGMTAHALMSKGGVGIFPSEALRFGIVKEQKTVHIHDDAIEPPPPPTGGWPRRRVQSTLPLMGPEHDSVCDVDVVDGNTLTMDTFFREYFVNERPVLIKHGTPRSWTMWEHLTPESLIEEFGTDEIEVSEIPYGTKYGNPDRRAMLTVDEYVNRILNDTVPGGRYPYYFFKGNSRGRETARRFLPKSGLYPLPRWLSPHMPQEPIREGEFDEHEADEDFNRSGQPSTFFGNTTVQVIQLGFGPQGSGAPMHFHSAAVNFVFHGAKRWIVIPPEFRLMSHVQMLEWVETQIEFWSHEVGHPFLMCTQEAGDALFVPPSWSHGVVNLYPTTALALEMRIGQEIMFPSGKGVPRGSLKRRSSRSSRRDSTPLHPARNDEL